MVVQKGGYFGLPFVYFFSMKTPHSKESILLLLLFVFEKIINRVIIRFSWNNVSLHFKFILYVYVIPLNWNNQKYMISEFKKRFSIKRHWKGIELVNLIYNASATLYLVLNNCSSWYYFTFSISCPRLWLLSMLTTK